MRVTWVAVMAVALAGCPADDEGTTPVPSGTDAGNVADPGPATVDEGSASQDEGPAPTDEASPPDDTPIGPDTPTPPDTAGPDLQCAGEAEGAPCDADGDACTIDHCTAAGACEATGGTDDCAAEQVAQPCWTWQCNGKSGCQKGVFLEGGSCDDKAGCTQTDTCVLNDFDQPLCVGTPLVIDDGNPCTDDSCVAGAVTHAPLDGTSCGAGKLCEAGACKEQSPACPPCAECEACDPGQGTCEPLGDGTGCSGDTNPCTLDACQAGACGHPSVADGTSCGLAKACDDGQCVDLPPPPACEIDWATGAASPGDVEHGPVSLVLGENIHVIGGSPSKTHHVLQTGPGLWIAGVAPPEGVSEGAGAVVGGRILVVDEHNEDGVLTYDPGSGKWTIGAPRPTPDGRGAGAGTDGTHLFVVGGADGNLNAHAMVHRYDPGQDEWTEVESMPTARGFVAYAQIGAVLYVVGGRDKQDSPSIQDANEAFDTGTGTWTELAPLPTARNSAAASVIGGLVYVSGGFNGSKKVSNVDRYDPNTNVWAECTALPKPVSQHGMAAHGGKLYFMGGGSDATTLWVGTVASN